MRTILQPVLDFIFSSSKAQGATLIAIGIAMLIATNSAETVEQPIIKEGVQIGIILGGIFGTALLFSRKRSDRQ